MKKNIVAIGGGAGTFNVLYGLKKNHDCNLSAIISVADNATRRFATRDCSACQRYRNGAKTF